jgi:hypothetical protein
MDRPLRVLVCTLVPAGAIARFVAAMQRPR